MTNPIFPWKYGKGSTTVIPAMQAFNVIIYGDRAEAAKATAKHLGSRPLSNVVTSGPSFGQQRTHGTILVENRDVLDAWFKESVEHAKASEHGDRQVGDLLWFHRA